MAHTPGRRGRALFIREYGRTEMRVKKSCALFDGLAEKQIGLMSHTDQVVILPEGFVSVARTENCPNAAVACPERRLYGVQFHPEVENTPNGAEMIRNFLYRVCDAAGDYSMEDYERRMIRPDPGAGGGRACAAWPFRRVDSSVCAALLAKCAPRPRSRHFRGPRLMRKNEGDEVEAAFNGREDRFYPRECGGAVLKQAPGRYRAGAEAKAHWGGVRPGL
jgi:GMP synthase (glutamine-hydrolysing)